MTLADRIRASGHSQGALYGRETVLALADVVAALERWDVEEHEDGTPRGRMCLSCAALARLRAELDGHDG